MLAGVTSLSFFSSLSTFLVIDPLFPSGLCNILNEPAVRRILYILYFHGIVNQVALEITMYVQGICRNLVLLSPPFAV